MSWKRFLSAIVAIALALGMLVLGSWYLTLGLGILVFLGLEEYFELARAKGMRPAWKTIHVVCQMLLVTANLRWQLPNGVQLPDAILPVAATLICAYLVFQRRPASIADIAASILGMFYAGFLPSFWIRLRNLGAPPHTDLPLDGYWPASLLPFDRLPQGLSVILLAFFCIWAADIGAYFIGKRYGRTQLSPISPKKTVEGAIGGVAACTTIALIGAVSLHWPTAPLTGLAFGLIVAMCSQLGDLTESMMKRDAGVKDSGQLIPGHGGILDRTDSYVFTAPMVYYVVVFLLPLLGH